MVAPADFPVIFMGTPDFAAASLRAIRNTGFDIAAVYTQPPRPKGRGQQVQKSPVHMLAEEYNLPVFYPARLKSEETQTQFVAHNAAVAVVAAYGLLLPKPVLDAPRFGCINIHASLLPRWRGASPIQQAILAGDETSGVTLMQMDQGLDTGPMLMRGEVVLAPDTTATILHDRLAGLGAELIVELLQKIRTEQILPAAEPQPKDGITYAPLLSKEDGLIDWTMPAQHIDWQVRALNPWPGVWSRIKERRLKILSLAVKPYAHSQKPGTVLDRAGHISCGSGESVQLLTLQPEGKKPMDFAAAFNGGIIKMGDLLG